MSLALVVSHSHEASILREGHTKRILQHAWSIVVRVVLIRCIRRYVRNFDGVFLPLGAVGKHLARGTELQVSDGSCQVAKRLEGLVFNQLRVGAHIKEVDRAHL